MTETRMEGGRAGAGRDEIWRPGYHFTAPTSWINDPNGLIYYRGLYHLFYQYNPKNCSWASMHWGHAVSDDMIHWRDMPVALKPDQDYDDDPEGGCFSGSAVEKDGILYLFYSATVKTGGRVRQTQCVALSEDGIHFEKYGGNPVIAAPPEGASEDFRDPKVFCHGEKWYMTLGGSVGGAESGDGRVFLYESNDLFDWTYRGTLLESGGELGTMFECPDFFFLDGKWVLTCSPMRHPDYVKALYCVGEMNFETCSYTILKTGNLDYGFDYYAPQSFLDARGNRVLIAWQNGWKWMPWCEDWGPTGQENWRGAFSIPRRAELRDMELCLYPVEELKALCSDGEVLTDVRVTSDKKYLSRKNPESFLCRIRLLIDRADSRCIQFGLFGKGDRAVVLTLDLCNYILTLDKSSADAYGRGIMNCRFSPSGNELNLLIMADHSSVEVYLDRGRYCITSNVYPDRDQRECWIRTPYKEAVVTRIEVVSMRSMWE